MRNKPLFLALLAFSFYLPFGIALSPMQGVDLASVRLWILIMLFFSVCASLMSRKLVLPRSLSGLLVMSFLFLNVFSVFFARNTDWSLRKLLFLFSIFPIYFIAINEMKSQGDAEKISRFLLWGGFGAALVGIFQFLFQFVVGIDPVYVFWGKNVAPLFLGKAFSEAVLQNPSWLVNVGGKTLLRATSIFPDPHMFSFYLGMLAPVALGLYLNSKKRIYLMALTVLILTDLLTFSRGGYLGLFAAAIALAVLFWKNMEGRYKLGMLFVSLALAMLMIIPNPVSNRFLSSFDFKEGSNAGRIETWKQALDVIYGHPVFGVGLGNYPLEIKPTADYREPIYAHSAYLDIAAETGMITLAVWVMLLLVVMYEFLLKAKENPLFLGFFLSILIFAAHSLVETPIYSPAVLALFLLIISFSVKLNENEKTVQS